VSRNNPIIRTHYADFGARWNTLIPLSTGGLRPGVAINHSIPPHQQHRRGQRAAPNQSRMQYLLPIIAMGNFAAGLTSRAIDPLLPQIAHELGINIPTAATLAASTAIAFAFVQLPLGAVADLFGKPRLILICLALLGIGNIVGAFTHSFELLLATRVICGAAAGGVFPVAMGLTGDLFPIQQRRIAMSRIMAGALSGNLLGATFSGVLGDLVGWRSVFVVLGSFIVLAWLAVAWGFRGQMSSPRHGHRDQDAVVKLPPDSHPSARAALLSRRARGGLLHHGPLPLCRGLPAAAR